MSRAEHIRTKLRDDRRDYRLEKMDMAARKAVASKLEPQLMAAYAAEREAREAMEERCDEDTRRRYLAAKMHRINMAKQNCACWT